MISLIRCLELQFMFRSHVMLMLLHNSSRVEDMESREDVYSNTDTSPLEAPSL